VVHHSQNIFRKPKPLPVADESPHNINTAGISAASIGSTSFIHYNGALSCLNKHSCIGSSMLHPVSQSVPSSFAALA
jgi:hypothetical protein